MFKNIETVIEKLKAMGPEKGSAVVNSLVQTSVAFERCAFLHERAGNPEKSKNCFMEAAELMDVVCKVSASDLDQIEDPPRIIAPKGPMVIR